MPLVTFIQPYVPAYRVPFFDELSRQLKDHGIELEVVHGVPGTAQAARGDASAGSWSVPVRSRRIVWAGHELHLRPVWRRTRRSTLVVAELASTNLDTYLLALDPRVRLMLWGHGKAYVTETSTLDARLELWLARRAEGVFVYTEGGAAYLRGQGYDADRLTVVRNSTDTVALRAAADQVSDTDIGAYRRELDLGDGPVACFVGGYDESKLLPLLFDAAALVHENLPGFRLLVAGAGPLHGLVSTRAEQQPWVRSLPRAGTAALALIGRTASCVVIPGRVGLVAVDALALGLPVVTTTYLRHAPEAEYLTDDVKVVASQTPLDLARAITELLTDEPRLTRARAAASLLGDQLNVEAMAAAFVGRLADSVRA